MASSLFLVLALLLFHSFSSIVQCRNYPSAGDDKLDTYIVHVRPIDEVIHRSGSLESYYRSFLPASPEGSDEPRLVYSYSEVFSGFAARLTGQELDEMSKKEGFVRAYPNRIIPLLTTHTPAYLGLQPGAAGGIWNSSSYGKGVVIGLLDTGILADHPSFSAEGMPAPPAKWKGTCQLKSGCNNKIIGARAYRQSGNDPSDDVGHGTHTSATAAGGAVPDVDAFGLGTGTPTGIAPKAHIAMYKVCSRAGCSSADILAGLDDAVKDGVDVLSLSLGGKSVPYNEDPIAVGSFAAIEKGIVVVCAAGNAGPLSGTLSNEAPWLLTVAASSVDRSFRSTVHLGGGKSFDGETLYQPTNFTSSPFPLVFPGGEKDDIVAAICSSLDGFDVKGKIVVCVSGEIGDTEKSKTVKDAGGVGMILLNTIQEGYSILASYHAVPTVHVSAADAEEIVAYLNSTKSPTGSITFNGTVLGTSPSPFVAHFSSNGPSMQSPGVLKPDVSAPGLNILAAWNSKVDDSSEGKFGYNVVSGTSMATPHVSGIAALVKSLHPDWSPAAIKSAILTTSDDQDRAGERIKDEYHDNASFFQKGNGHVNPTNAAEPGLVYDLGVDDYVSFLCGLGLGDDAVGAIIKRKASCSGLARNVTQIDLNYPSIIVPWTSLAPVTVNRTVTNVGDADDADAKYTHEVVVPEGMTVKVVPETLQFSKVNEKITFSVTIGGDSGQGHLKWVSGKVGVRIPLIRL